MKILHKAPLFCFALTLLISSHSRVLAKSLEAEYNLQHNQPSISQQKISQPQHLLLNALDLKENGYLAQALAKLSEAYGEEKILIAGYYNLLDRKRRIILKEIENGAPWFPDDSGSKKALQSIKNRFKKLQPPEEMANPSMPYETIALPRERFINYKIVQTVLNKDAQDSLYNPDPWMVSTILFLARKGEVKVSPQDVIRRWEGRPDLWDDVTEEQALLYLATLPTEMIRTLTIHNDDVRNVIQSRFKEKDNPLLLQCSSNIDRDNKIVFIDTSIVETESYESLKRVEISLRDKNGKEFFRAMNNRSSVCAPIPPNAFGVFPVGEKKALDLKDVKSAGMGANIPQKTKYGYLMPGCTTRTANGILTIHWLVKMESSNLPVHTVYPFVKVVPQGEKDAPWNFCASSSDNPQFALPAETGLTSVTPLLCFEENASCRVAERITLVHLSRQKRKGVVQKWPGDTAFAYSYTVLSKEVIDIKDLPEHTIVLEPGFYRFEYNDVGGDPPAGFYGKSKIFEVNGGGRMEIKVRVNSAL